MREGDDRKLTQLAEWNEHLRKSADLYFKMIDEVEDYAHYVRK